MKTYTVLFALAFLASFVGTPLLRRLWLRLGFLDSAVTAGVHLRRPVPRLGGVVIYFALLFSLAALLFPSNVITEQFRAQLPVFWMLLGPATFVLLVGVADDIFGMRAWVKFGGQVAAGVWLVSLGVQITHISLPWGGRLELGWLAAGATLLWLVALTNAFNLIDGLDGLAAGVGFLAASAIAVTAMLTDDKMVVVVSVVLAGSLLGFLRHNFNPATIFLGDSGSMLVGFVLAASAVIWHQKTTTVIAVAAPLLAFALPVLDTSVAVVRRWLRGQPVFVSDRHHIHHRLLALGLTPRQVVLLLYGVSALAALGCIFVAQGHNLLTGMVLLLFTAACMVGVGRLSYPEFLEFGRMFSRGRLRARMRLADVADQLRTTTNGHDLWHRLQDNAKLLGVDFIRVELPPDQQVRLRLNVNGPPPGSSGLWRLCVPLLSGGHLVLERKVKSSAPDLPLEVVAEELHPLVEKALNELTQEEAPRSSGKAPTPATDWVSSEEGVV